MHNSVVISIYKTSSDNTRMDQRLVVVVSRVYVVRTMDDRVESVLVVRGVVDFTDGAVGLHQLVETLQVVSLPRFVLAFDVVCVGVVHLILEHIVRRSLKRVQYITLQTLRGLNYWNYSKVFFETEIIFKHK